LATLKPFDKLANIKLLLTLTVVVKLQIITSYNLALHFVVERSNDLVSCFSANWVVIMPHLETDCTKTAIWFLSLTSNNVWFLGVLYFSYIFHNVVADLFWMQC